MFEPGEKVVCVDARFPHTILDYYQALPKMGAVYTVRDLVPGIDWADIEAPALYLEELVNRPNEAGTEPGFAVWRFTELGMFMQELKKEAAKVRGN